MRRVDSLEKELATVKKENEAMGCRIVSLEREMSEKAGRIGNSESEDGRTMRRDETCEKDLDGGYHYSRFQPGFGHIGDQP